MEYTCKGDYHIPLVVQSVVGEQIPDGTKCICGKMVWLNGRPFYNAESAAEQLENELVALSEKIKRLEAWVAERKKMESDGK